MRSGLKCATSKKTRDVESLILECSPPITPAKPMAPEASQIINSSPVNLRSTPSSVLKRVPAGKLSTINLPPLISFQS